METSHPIPEFHPQYQVYVFHEPGSWRKEHEAQSLDSALDFEATAHQAGHAAVIIKWDPTHVVATTPKPEPTPRKSRKEIAE